MNKTVGSTNYLNTCLVAVSEIFYYTFYLLRKRFYDVPEIDLAMLQQRAVITKEDLRILPENPRISFHYFHMIFIHFTKLMQKSNLVNKFSRSKLNYYEKVTLNELIA